MTMMTFLVVRAVKNSLFKICVVIFGPCVYLKTTIMLEDNKIKCLRALKESIKEARFIR